MSDYGLRLNATLIVHDDESIDLGVSCNDTEGLNISSETTNTDLETGVMFILFDILNEYKKAQTKEEEDEEEEEDVFSSYNRILEESMRRNAGFSSIKSTSRRSSGLFDEVDDEEEDEDEEPIREVHNERRNLGTLADFLKGFYS